MAVVRTTKSCVFMQHCWATRDAWQNKRFLWANVVGNLSLCLIYELSHNAFHILPTCCHCTESSAEDKFAFKWGKLFSLRPLWITNAGALICDERTETGGFFSVIDPENVEWTRSLFFFFSAAALHQTRKVQLVDSWELLLSSLQPEPPKSGAEQFDWCKLSCLKDNANDFQPYL